MRFVLDVHKMIKSSHLSHRILNFYVEALTEFSHIFHPNELNSTLFSQGCVLEMAPFVRMVGRT